MVDSKRKAILFLILALIVAILAGYVFMNKISEMNASLGEMTTFYVAKQDIQPRSPLDPSLFQKEQMPKRFAPPSLVTQLTDIQKKVTIVPMHPGDVVMDSLLRDASAIQGEGADHRIVRVMMSDRVQFDSALNSFDRVDIIVSKRKDNEKAPITDVFMKDVLVREVYSGPAPKQQDKSVITGVGLDLPLADAVRLIDVENYAEHIRILKATNQKTP